MGSEKKNRNTNNKKNKKRRNKQKKNTLTSSEQVPLDSAQEREVTIGLIASLLQDSKPDLEPTRPNPLAPPLNPALSLLASPIREKKLNITEWQPLLRELESNIINLACGGHHSIIPKITDSLQLIHANIKDLSPKQIQQLFLREASLLKAIPRVSPKDTSHFFQYFTEIFKRHVAQCSLIEFKTIKLDLYEIGASIYENLKLSEFSDRTEKEEDPLIYAMIQFGYLLGQYTPQLQIRNLDHPDKITDLTFEINRIDEIRISKKNEVNFDFNHFLDGIKLPPASLLTAKRISNWLAELKMKHSNNPVFVDKLSVIICFLDFFVSAKPDTFCNQLITHFAEIISKKNKSLYLAYEIFLRTCQINYHLLLNNPKKSKELFEQLRVRQTDILQKIDPENMTMLDKALLEMIRRAEVNHLINEPCIKYYKLAPPDDYKPEVPEVVSIHSSKLYIQKEKPELPDFSLPIYIPKNRSTPVIRKQRKVKPEKKEKKPFIRTNTGSQAITSHATEPTPKIEEIITPPNPETPKQLVAELKTFEPTSLASQLPKSKIPETKAAETSSPTHLTKSPPEDSGWTVVRRSVVSQKKLAEPVTTPMPLPSVSTSTTSSTITSTSTPSVSIESRPATSTVSDPSKSSRKSKTAKFKNKNKGGDSDDENAADFYCPSEDSTEDDEPSSDINSINKALDEAEDIDADLTSYYSQSWDYDEEFPQLGAMPREENKEKKIEKSYTQPSNVIPSGSTIASRIARRVATMRAQQKPHTEWETEVSLAPTQVNTSKNPEAEISFASTTHRPPSSALNPLDSVETPQSGAAISPTVAVSLTPSSDTFPVTSVSSETITTASLTTTVSSSTSLDSTIPPSPNTSLDTLTTLHVSLSLEETNENLKKEIIAVARTLESEKEQLNVGFKTATENFYFLQAELHFLERELERLAPLKYTEITTLSRKVAISAPAEAYFNNRINEIEDGIKTDSEIIYTDLSLSYALLESQLDKYSSLLASGTSPISAQGNLKIKNHQIKNPDKIVTLGQMLSSPVLAAPHISIGGNRTTNQFLTFLSLTLAKKNPKKYMDSLVHLDLTDSNTLIADQDALRDILLLLDNNPMLVIIDFDPIFKTHLNTIDRDFLLTEKLKKNLDNLKAFIKNLILLKDIDQLQQIFGDFRNTKNPGGNPAIRDLLGEKTHFDELINFASMNNCREGLEFLLSVYCPSSSQVDDSKATFSSIPASSDDKASTSTAATTMQLSAVTQKAPIAQTTYLSSRLASNENLLDAFTLEQQNKLLNDILKEIQIELESQRRQAATHMEDILQRCHRLENQCRELNYQLFRIQNKTKISDLQVKEEQFLAAKQLMKQQPIIRQRAIQVTSQIDAEYFENFLTFVNASRKGTHAGPRPEAILPMR